MDEWMIGWLGGWLALAMCALVLSYCEPKSVARGIPAWAAVWFLRAGMYVQAMGRECYHQCDKTKQAPIHAKMDKLYGHKD